MKVWQVAREWTIEGLELAERPTPTPGPGEVAVRIRAATLNYRDLLTVQGRGGATKLPLVPFSDGAGEVIATGDGVTRVAVGDRVCQMFFQSWFDGGACLAPLDFGPPYEISTPAARSPSAKFSPGRYSTACQPCLRAASTFDGMSSMNTHSPGGCGVCRWQ